MNLWKKSRGMMAGLLSASLLLSISTIGYADETGMSVENGGVQSAVQTESKIPVIRTGNVPQTLSAPPEIVGEAGIVVDMATGFTLYEKNINDAKYPASITKIMTATLALENLKMEDVITFSHDAVYTVEPGSSSAYAAEGEQLTVEQCLYGLMLISGNDLANGLGEAVAGSMDAFAQKMTEKAAALGCTNTQFKNAHGLHDEGHYTTAHDMAIIGMNAYQNFETFRTLCSTIRYDVPPTNLCQETRYWLNNNRMIRPGEDYYYEDCIGGKTGYTNEAGGTLVTYENLNGRQVICVILKSQNSAGAYSDTIALCDYIKANVTQADFDAFDAKIAEEESLAAAALQESIKNAETTTQQDVKANADVKEQESKGMSTAAIIVLSVIVLFLAVYFYVVYRRYQQKQKMTERRRQWEEENRKQSIQDRKLEKELEQRRKKYRNYDFSEKK